MLHIYYGMGKGKTSTLNGSAIRATGAGLKVLYAKFLKGRESSEDKIISNTVDKFIRVQSSEKFVIQMKQEEKNKTKQEVIKALKQITNEVNNYDVFILDEILDLIVDNVSLITEEELIEFLLEFKHKDILVSGHTITKKLKENADLITKFKAKKHYFDKGIKAKQGIEY